MYSDEVRAELSRRTRAGLAAAKARGVRLGRPSRVNEAWRIAKELREAGFTMQAIANELTARGIRTATGKTVWSTSSVQSLLRTIALDQEALVTRRRTAGNPTQEAQ
jgi:DNA invertase Pin-like site-specific DNA recombinase